MRKVTEEKMLVQEKASCEEPDWLPLPASAYLHVKNSVSPLSLRCLFSRVGGFKPNLQPSAFTPKYHWEWSDREHNRTPRHAARFLIKDDQFLPLPIFASSALFQPSSVRRTMNGCLWDHCRTARRLHVSPIMFCAFGCNHIPGIGLSPPLSCSRTVRDMLFSVESIEIRG